MHSSLTVHSRVKQLQPIARRVKVEAMVGSHTAFFYGTLMHPKILMRVIANNGSHLQLCRAILLDYTRHRVKDADYPGVVPLSQSEGLFKRELTREEKSVRGMLVTGLTDADVSCLDIFEGDEYERRRIEVYPLEGFKDISAYAVDDDTLLTHSTALVQFPTESHRPTSAETYVYCDVTDLEVRLWSYEDFVRRNAWKWYGTATNENEDMTEVDRRRLENELLRN